MVQWNKSPCEDWFHGPESSSSDPHYPPFQSALAGQRRGINFQFHKRPLSLNFTVEAKAGMGGRFSQSHAQVKEGRCKDRKRTRDVRNEAEYMGITEMEILIRLCTL